MGTFRQEGVALQEEYLKFDWLVYVQCPDLRQELPSLGGRRALETTIFEFLQSQRAIYHKSLVLMYF